MRKQLEDEPSNVFKPNPHADSVLSSAAAHELLNDNSEVSIHAASIQQNLNSMPSMFELSKSQTQST